MTLVISKYSLARKFNGVTCMLGRALNGTLNVTVLVPVGKFTALADSKRSGISQVTLNVVTVGILDCKNERITRRNLNALAS